MNEKKMEKKNPTPKRIDHELTSWQNQTDHDGNQWTRSEGYPGNMRSYVGIKAGWSQRDFFFITIILLYISRKNYIIYNNQFFSKITYVAYGRTNTA